MFLLLYSLFFLSNIPIIQKNRFGTLLIKKGSVEKYSCHKFSLLGNDTFVLTFSLFLSLSSHLHLSSHVCLSLFSSSSLFTRLSLFLSSSFIFISLGLSLFSSLPLFSLGLSLFIFIFLLASIPHCISPEKSDLTHVPECVSRGPFVDWRIARFRVE